MENNDNLQVGGYFKKLKKIKVKHYAPSIQLIICGLPTAKYIREDC